MKKLDVVAALLVVIGGLNWGLVGIAGIDLVATLFGPMSLLGRAVYVLVGLSALTRQCSGRAFSGDGWHRAHAARA